MSESFVDLTCRGLPLGRRIKLTQVRPSSGYLELPTPMPVGTAIVIATDDGVTLPAMVTHVFEQIGGSDRVPGMTVAPALAEAEAAVVAWWQARVALPDLATTVEAPVPPPRPRPLTVRPRSGTTPMPTPPAGATAAPEPAMEEVDDRPTAAMPALDPATLEAATVEAASDPPAAPLIVDDGKKTVMMLQVDLKALGLEPGASGGIPVAAGGDVEADASGPVDVEADASGPVDVEADASGPVDAAGSPESPESPESPDSDDAEAHAGAGTNGDPRAAVPAPPTGVGDRKPVGKKRKKRR